MDLQQTVSLGSENFSRVLDDVADSDLARETPCDAWSVNDLIWHVARGCDMSVLLLSGASKAEASQLFAVAAPSDVVGQCRRALVEQLNAFEADRDLEQIVHHPMGDVPVRQLFDFRIVDLTVHSWDLSRALGVDEAIPEELVAHGLAMLEPLEGIIGQIGVFGAGPSGSLDLAASPQSRLLDLSGRRA
jgi:uncharacterized protein (TIGR03086 family)